LAVMHRSANVVVGDDRRQIPLRALRSVMLLMTTHNLGQKFFQRLLSPHGAPHGFRPRRQFIVAPRIRRPKINQMHRCVRPLRSSQTSSIVNVRIGANQVVRRALDDPVPSGTARRRSVSS
jgi:hypothetical protein